MTNENLYLIGTIHTDLGGPERLEGLLNQISPEIVALEFSEDRMERMEGIKNMSLEEGEKEIDDLIMEIGLSVTSKQKKAMLDVRKITHSVYSYEFYTSKSYTDKNPNSKLEYIDLPLLDKVQKFYSGYIKEQKRELKSIAQDPKLKKAYLETLNNGGIDLLYKSQEAVEALYRNNEINEEVEKVLRDPKALKIETKQLSPKEVEALKEILHPERDDAMANRIRELYDSGNKRVVGVVGLLHLSGLKSRISDLDPTIMTLADYEE